MIKDGKIKLYNKFRNTSCCRVERYLNKKDQKKTLKKNYTKKFD